MRVPTNILTRSSLWEESLRSYTNPRPLDATSCIMSKGWRRREDDKEEGERMRKRRRRRRQGR